MTDTWLPGGGIAAGSGGKLASIQLLRAVAASVVAVLHVAFAFADHIGPGLGLSRAAGGLAGQAAVLLFFIVSGYVMVIATRGQFGQPGARQRFWWRRFNRIMPPYWLATFALVLVFLSVKAQPISWPDVLRSLVLLPYWPQDGGLRPLPFLWVGWTLFYEMAFYVLLGLCLGLGPRAGLAATALVLAALVLAGIAVPPDNAFLFAVTRPVLLMFVYGMALAAWRGAGRAAPAWLRLFALIAALVAAGLVAPPGEIGAMGFDYLLWCGLPAALLAFCVLGGPLRVPGERLILAAGDMSYALYLLHVPAAWFWQWFWRRLPWFDPGPWDYLASCLVATYAASWLFYAHVERPMTAGLNRRTGSPHVHHLAA